MLQEEKGPFEIFSRLQAWFWSDPIRLGGLKDGLRCFNCTSVWISFFMALAIEHANWALFFVYWFAIAAIAIFVNRFNEKLEQ